MAHTTLVCQSVLLLEPPDPADAEVIASFLPSSSWPSSNKTTHLITPLVLMLEQGWDKSGTGEVASAPSLVIQKRDPKGYSLLDPLLL